MIEKYFAVHFDSGLILLGFKIISLNLQLTHWNSFNFKIRKRYENIAILIKRNCNCRKISLK